MVEAPAGPASGMVTLLTVFTQIADVHIVILMAAAAGRTLADKPIVFMAIFTGRGGMPTQQWKHR